jgi:paraquat-inducible protein A
LILAVPAATLPLVSVSRFGSEHTGLLFSGVRALWNGGMPTLGVWVLICGGVAPALLLVALGGLLISERLGWRLPGLTLLEGIAAAVAEWTMPEVQVLAVLVAVVKIGSVVHIAIGPGLWCYAGMSMAILLALRSFHSHSDAANNVLLSNEPLRANGRSLSLPAALGLSAVLMLVPANLLPVIRTTLGQTRDDTIYTGILSLFDRGLWGIGIIVFAASIMVPILKLVGLIFLLLAARGGAGRHLPHLQRLYAVMNFIGRWSMLDVFLVAFLSGVIQFGAFASVQPRPGIIAFAVAVVLTMLATRAFDPRLLEHRQGTECQS